MKKQALVSIIIPTLNRAALLMEALESIRNQKYKNWECIVVDDGSTDETFSIVQSLSKTDKRISIHSRPENYASGGNGARNYGFELCKGEYVQWFDSDDIMLPDKLIAEIELLQKYKLDFVISSGYSADCDLQNLKKKELYLGQDLYVSYTTWSSEIFLPSVCFKTKFLKSHSLFNEKLVRGQENEFFSRIFYKTRKSARFRTIGGHYYIYRQHNENKRSTQRENYMPGYISSFVFLSIENFKRGQEMAAIKVMRFHYKNLLNYFYLALNNGDKVLSKHILKSLLPLLWKAHKKQAMLFFLGGYLSLIRGNSIYFIEKKLKNTGL